MGQTSKKLYKNNITDQRNYTFEKRFKKVIQFYKVCRYFVEHFLIFVHRFVFDRYRV